jgi:hypothetical protein
VLALVTLRSAKTATNGRLGLVAAWPAREGKGEKMR